MVALLLAGSAISLMACGTPPKPSGIDDEKIISRTVHDMETLASENGEKKQLVRAAVMEEHAFADPPFTEYVKGIDAVLGYDSIGRPASTIVADYALHWTERDLWELNGNVVVTGEEGQRLYTQQLRWDRKIKKIYSNVDSKVEDESGVTSGIAFEAADDFSWWTFLNIDGTAMVDARPAETAADSTVVNATPTPADRQVETPQPAETPAPSTADAPSATPSTDSLTREP